MRVHREYCLLSVHTFFVFCGSVGEFDVHFVLPGDFLHLVTLGTHHSAVVLLRDHALDRHLGVLQTHTASTMCTSSNIITTTPVIKIILLTTQAIFKHEENYIPHNHDAIILFVQLWADKIYSLLKTNTYNTKDQYKIIKKYYFSNTL